MYSKPGAADLATDSLLQRPSSYSLTNRPPVHLHPGHSMLHVTYGVHSTGFNGVRSPQALTTWSGVRTGLAARCSGAAAWRAR